MPDVEPLLDEETRDMKTYLIQGQEEQQVQDHAPFPTPGLAQSFVTDDALPCTGSVLDTGAPFPQVPSQVIRFVQIQLSPSLVVSSNMQQKNKGED